MAATTFIPVDAAQIATLKSTIRTVYELDAEPDLPSLAAGQTVGQDIRIRMRSTETDFSLSAGFEPLASGSVDASYEHYAMDIMLLRTVQGSADSVVRSATYGAGGRFLIQARKLSADIDLRLPQLAAQTELGMVEASLALHLRGLPADLPDDFVPAGLFTFEEFDLERYAKANTFIDTLQSYLLSVDRTTLDPVLVGVEVANLYADDIVDALHSGNYALWSVLDRYSLTKALEVAERYAVPLDLDIVRRTYATIMQRPALALAGAEASDIGQVEPDREHVRQARRLLKQFRRVSAADGVGD